MLVNRLRATQNFLKLIEDENSAPSVTYDQNDIDKPHACLNNI